MYSRSLSPNCQIFNRLAVNRLPRPIRLRLLVDRGGGTGVTTCRGMWVENNHITHIARPQTPQTTKIGQVMWVHVGRGTHMSDPVKYSVKCPYVGNVGTFLQDLQTILFLEKPIVGLYRGVKLPTLTTKRVYTLGFTVFAMWVAKTTSKGQRGPRTSPDPLS